MSKTRTPHCRDVAGRSFACIAIVLLFLCFSWNGAAYGAGLVAQGEAGVQPPVPAGEKGVEATVNKPPSATGGGTDEYGDVAEEEGAGEKADEYGNVVESETGTDEGAHIADPIEPWNRAMYHFNDKLYFWALKPAAQGYGYVLPEDIRVLISNFYQNIRAPIRIVNNLLQGKPGYAGLEFTRLLINSTIGVAGFRDCATECFGISGRDADFGQTLGEYGLGPGFYIVWPFVGPMSARDSVGFAVDWNLSPTTYVVWPSSSQGDLINPLSIILFAHRMLNYTSFHIGDYETIKAAAIDPYVAIRDAYAQSRKKAIEKK